jgi:hypothetical protein
VTLITSPGCVGRNYRTRRTTHAHALSPTRTPLASAPRPLQINFLCAKLLERGEGAFCRRHTLTRQ